MRNSASNENADDAKEGGNESNNDEAKDGGNLSNDDEFGSGSNDEGAKNAITKRPDENETAGEKQNPIFPLDEMKMDLEDA